MKKQKSQQSQKIQEKLTCDELGIAGFVLYQPQKGYRFTIDAVLLGTLAPLASGYKVADFGCGSGILLLLLKAREPNLFLTGIELEKNTAELAAFNMEQNGVAADIIAGDAMESDKLLPPDGRESFDLIVSNPPYYKPEECRLPKDGVMALAKTELAWDRNRFMRQSSLLLKPDGMLCVIAPPETVSELRSGGQKYGLVLTKIINIRKQNGCVLRNYAEFKKVSNTIPNPGFSEENLVTGSEEYNELLGIYHGAWTVSGGYTGGKS